MLRSTCVLTPVLALGLLCLAPIAQAETFTCQFTEPFFTLTYATQSERLTRKSADERPRVTKRVSFSITGPGAFVLKDRKGKELARLELSNKGSDGMGNTVYPYEIKLPDAGGANNGLGGCSSSLLPKKEGK